jgi:hypothetical protein
MAAALALGGCLEDLPQAQLCPEAPARSGEAAACAEAIGAAVMNGYQFDLTDACLLDVESFTSCYRGPGGCACDERECTPPGAVDACFPQSDCPPLVRLHHPEARCVTLGRDDIGRGATEAEQCLCGCEACLGVCDGRGPVWGQVEAFDLQTNQYLDPQGFLYFDVLRSMPNKGRMGVYLRARGFATQVMNLESGPPFVGVVPSDGSMGSWALPLPPLLADGFEELVLASQPEDLYAWDSDADKPSILGVAAGINTLTLMEIDCVIPFFIE